MEFTENQTAIIVAIIGAVGAIIAAIIATLKTIKRKRIIEEESDDYNSEFVPIKESIELESIDPSLKLLPLPLAGWSAWGGIKVARKGNKDVINGTVRKTSGLTNANFNKDLREKTLIMYFSNSKKSKFNQGRMVKLTVNDKDKLLKPNNRTLIFDEFLSAEDTPLNQGVEYTIPKNFDGKLGLTFYQAKLKDLSINAFYK